AWRGATPRRARRESSRLFVENALSADPPAGLVDEIVAYRTANPPDGAGWYAPAGAGAANRPVGRVGDIRADTLLSHTTRWAGSVTSARRRSSSTGQPTMSWTRATRR